MKRKNNKGFTLIELLAVIVILGIILTIVVSNVVKYIKQAKQGSYKDAVSVFVKNVQTELLSNQTANTGTMSVTDCDDGGATTCKSKFEYDSTNMKIKIDSGNVTITGISGFASLDMSGHCPTYKNADCATAGVIKFTMDTSDGSVN